MSPHVAETEVQDTAEHRAHDAPAPRTEAEELHVRSSDLEPYIGLRYLSKLFRFMAIILVLLLVAEVVTGLVKQGSAAIPTLLGEMSRLIVLAGLLWGTGDLAILLIDVGHDVRATRILMGRQLSHHEATQSNGDAAPRGRDAVPHRRAAEITTR